jgi:Mg2+-importing ATPase
MTIARDHVEEETITKPRRWNLAFIRKFMIAFGLLSSVFDFATFGILLRLMHAGTTQFRTGWFVESVVSASLIVLVVRSPYSIFKTRPGKYLVLAVLFVVVLALIIPFTPVASILGFVALPLSYLVALLAIVAGYIASTEVLKRIIFRQMR